MALKIMAKLKQIFICSDCGNESIKWNAVCPYCKQWNTLTEMTIAADYKKPSVDHTTSAKITPINEVDFDNEQRYTTGLGELDRVMGGGVVIGSLILVGGDPGIGKSTLLLQICEYICKLKTCYYVSGEESPGQIKLRANRLGVKSENLSLISDTNLDNVINAATIAMPDVLIIDSIQTMSCNSVSSAPGSVTQIKEATALLMRLAKEKGITVFIIGHVTKEGAIAGPKILEHMVDTVLYFEGDKNLSHRVLRAVKNRFGATNEIAVFDMCTAGLVEIDNPSKMFLDGRPENVPGTCVSCVMEGTRPILAEIQALVAKTAYPAPRRMASGVDYNRMSLLVAVLEKRAGFQLFNQDVYVNVVGGFRIVETATDLAMLIAIASSLLDFEVPSDLIAIGEAGLSGEIRAVSHIENRINEAKRLGFTKIMVPSRNKISGDFSDVEIIKISSVKQAIYKISKEM